VSGAFEEGGELLCEKDRELDPVDPGGLVDPAPARVDELEIVLDAGAVRANRDVLDGDVLQGQRGAEGEEEERRVLRDDPHARAGGIVEPDVDRHGIQHGPGGQSEPAQPPGSHLVDDAPRPDRPLAAFLEQAEDLPHPFGDACLPSLLPIRLAENAREFVDDPLPPKLGQRLGRAGPVAAASLEPGRPVREDVAREDVEAHRGKHARDEGEDSGVIEGQDRALEQAAGRLTADSRLTDDEARGVPR
jgi:hypothetical protein